MPTPSTTSPSLPAPSPVPQPSPPAPSPVPQRSGSKEHLVGDVHNHQPVTPAAFELINHDGSPWAVEVKIKGQCAEVLQDDHLVEMDAKWRRKKSRYETRDVLDTVTGHHYHGDLAIWSKVVLGLFLAVFVAFIAFFVYEIVTSFHILNSL